MAAEHCKVATPFRCPAGTLHCGSSYFFTQLIAFAWFESIVWKYVQALSKSPFFRSSLFSSFNFWRILKLMRLHLRKQTRMKCRAVFSEQHTAVHIVCQQRRVLESAVELPESVPWILSATQCQQFLPPLEDDHLAITAKCLRGAKQSNDKYESICDAKC